MNELLIEEKINKLNIGDRIKMLRTTQKRTMQEIAEASELSKSMISKIENNKTVPSCESGMSKSRPIISCGLMIIVEGRTGSPS